MSNYNHKEVEAKWKSVWEKSQIYKTKKDSKKEKFYVLDMFPYPSGSGLHVGHPKGYIATDVIARMKMMQGFNVLHPMGWDAFGLPAENYALANKVHPSEATAKNIETFKRQLGLLGFTYDWDREVNTTDPNYYKWTQWAFIQMFRKGLAFESNEPINWCPTCKTGLANEDLETHSTSSGQVSVCERCGTPVERKPLRQWVLKITDYADRLLNDIDKLSAWPEPIKEMQRNWIGKSEGALVKFSIKNSEEVLEVFTTRPDTLFGATYCVIAPEHPLFMNNELGIKNYDEVSEYIIKAKNKSDLERTENKEKTGVELKGIKVINPVNNEEIPIFVADYVLTGYGTGAIMAVPAHDERDFEFAKKFGLPVKEVVVEKIGERQKNTVKRDASCSILLNKKDEILVLYNKMADQYQLPGGGIENNNFEDTAIRELKEETGFKNFKLKEYLGKIEVNYYAKGRNEGRNRILSGYLFILENDKKEPLSKDDENRFEYFWLSPKEALKKFDLNKQTWGDKEFVEKYLTGGFQCFSGEGTAINSDFLNGLSTTEAKAKMIAWLEEKGIGQRKIQYKLRDWVFSRQRYWGEPIPLIHCEKCGWIPVPEKDLPLELPKVKNYEPSGTGESPLANIEEWVNTKCPVCGGPAKRETNTMPQWAGSCWYYLGYCMPKDKKTGEYSWDKEKINYWNPVDLYVGGAEHATRHLIYARFWHKFLFEIGAVANDEPFTRLQNVGLILAEDGRKMSKRWNNVINPDDIVEQYGADAMRLYEMFMGPFDQHVAWSTKGVIGCRRFLEKVWALKSKVHKVEKSIKSDIDTLLHQTIKKVSEDIEAMRYNTAISQLMILVNEMNKEESLSITSYKLLITLLSPFAPHIAEELWSELRNKESIFKSDWPKYDSNLIQDETITIAVQVNGKLRDTFDIPADLSEEEIKKLAVTSEKVQKWLEGKEPKKVIYVKGKLVSVVV